jgi:hypothetical protein
MAERSRKALSTTLDDVVVHPLTPAPPPKGARGGLHPRNLQVNLPALLLPRPLVQGERLKEGVRRSRSQTIATARQAIISAALAEAPADLSFDSRKKLDGRFRLIRTALALPIWIKMAAWLRRGIRHFATPGLALTHEARSSSFVQAITRIGSRAGCER